MCLCFIAAKSRNDLNTAVTPDRPDAFDFEIVKAEQNSNEYSSSGFATVPRTPKKYTAAPNFVTCSPYVVVQHMPSNSTPNLSQLNPAPSSSQRSLNVEESSPKLHRANGRRRKKDSGRNSTDYKGQSDKFNVETPIESGTLLKILCSGIRMARI